MACTRAPPQPPRKQTTATPWEFSSYLAHGAPTPGCAVCGYKHRPPPIFGPPQSGAFDGVNKHVRATRSPKHATNIPGGRLSVARCREILGDDAPESDEDLRIVRDHLYTLANAAIDSAMRESVEWD